MLTKYAFGVLLLPAVAAAAAASPGPADPDANPAARKLLRYLWGISHDTSSLQMVFGHQLDTTSGQHWTDPDGAHNRSDTVDSVGDYPGMFGMNGFAMAKSNLSQQACTVVRRMPLAGIIALHFPADNPVTGGTHKDHSQSPMVNLLPGGRGNTQWTAWLDVVARFCHGIKDRAVLFRPFHENLGSWNWWGANATTPSQYQAGWNYTVHYLRHVRGVHNLLSVYAPDKPALYFGEWRGLLERYPGDDLVDVVAFDHYDTGDGNYSSSLADCCAMVAKLAAARSKIPAIAEFGFKKGSEHVNASRSNWFVDSFLRPVVRRMARPPRVAYAMTWTNSERSYWVPSPAQPAHSGFVAFFRSHATLFAADLPPKDILIGAVRSPRPQAALSPVRTSDDRAAAEK